MMFVCLEMHLLGKWSSGLLLFSVGGGFHVVLAPSYPAVRESPAPIAPPWLPQRTGLVLFFPEGHRCFLQPHAGALSSCRTDSVRARLRPQAVLPMGETCT